MAHPEKLGLAGLKIETSFNHQHPGRSNENRIDRRRSTEGSDGTRSDHLKSDHDQIVRCRDANDDRSVLSETHSATRPISVPRHEGRHLDDSSSFPDRPDDVQNSPLDNYFKTRRASITFNPKVSLGEGVQCPLDEPLVKGGASARPPLKFESRTSGLRNALTQSDISGHSTHESWGCHLKRAQDAGGIPTGAPCPRPSRSAEREMPPGHDIDQPTSLTSLSTVSPVAEEVRTPPESVKDSFFSPLFITSPTQSVTSPDDRSGSWSAGVITPFGSKTRRPALDRSGSLRQSGSRRSTLSSGKSPASAFLSMWSAKDEPVASPDDEGQTVGTDYVLGKQIGFGGFSVVKEAYKVEDHGATKRLAVKIVKKNMADRSERENEEVQAEFDHEVRVWRYLNHPHVLTLDAVYETDYATFCFTKLAIGGTLFDLIRQNRQGLDMTLAKKYSYQLACAIRYLHEDARVVHRDIKLENCLLDPVESPDGSTSSSLVLCDFGMAEWMTTDDGGESPDPYSEAADRPPPKQMGPADSSTSIAGSLEYASPELLESTSGIIHPSVDIWAFGVIVYTVIVGSRPFQDAFMPRIRSNIVSGTWNREAITNGVTDPELLKDRQDALDLVRGCLEMNVNKRWNIRDVLASAWLRGVAQSVDDYSNDTVWKL
ncbi:Non-specific serine/threonine protein kinase [Penicillium ucsense]|uniref:Non-specific serine/threonine protein kinase n=1 Tax=Penicillium ucsense TaxID=2839758 RepID=A0A8J8WEB1_9EURO|nr:Non-specific serine/threonine protein kinase [Penicillium ucsense]KAF7735458.1 Non-specific serine/threonine protein kinase [Penicillium ucsense]